MKPHEKVLVQDTWALVAPISGQAAELFYSRLFELDPAIKPLFAATNMKKQGQVLMQALSLTVKNLNSPDVLLPVLEALGRRHAGYGVKDKHYDTVGAALLWTLGQGLGAKFTPDAKKAWTEAYGLVASVMKAAANQKAA